MAPESEILAKQAWFRENAALFSGELHFSEPLSKYTYYRIGGPALVLAIPKTAADLEWLARAIQKTGIPYFILGQGSNVLFPDAGYPGLVIRGSRMNQEITLVGEDSHPAPAPGRRRLRTGASVAISTLLRRASQEGLGGLEFLAGVPGSVGGVIRMNAGTNIDVSQSPDRLFRGTSFFTNQFSYRIFF